MGDREIFLNKKKLIEKLEENKKKHIEEYKQAVIDFKEEATKQLTEQLKQVGDGSLRVKIELISPVNRETDYDKIISMFDWEINDDVKLSQDEFNQYVLDDNGRQKRRNSCSRYNELRQRRRSVKGYEG